MAPFSTRGSEFSTRSRTLWELDFRQRPNLRSLPPNRCCCGIERIYVHEKVYDEFVKKAVDLTNTYKLGSPMDPETTIGPMVNNDIAKKVREHIKEAVAKGAKQLVDLKKFPEDKEDTAYNYIAPQIFVNVDHTFKMMSEETFGPIVGIMKVKSDEEAIELMNDSEYGLTASIWTRDIEKGEQLGDSIETGTVYVNRCDYGDPALAWTGAKYSGRGCSMSKYGWDLMTRVKSYHVRAPPAPKEEETVAAKAAPVAAAAASVGKEGSGSYIVVFKAGVAKDVVEKAIKDVEAKGGKINHRYDTVFTGFAATVPDSVLCEFELRGGGWRLSCLMVSDRIDSLDFFFPAVMKQHPSVDYIEADGEVSALAKKMGI